MPTGTAVGIVGMAWSKRACVRVVETIISLLEQLPASSLDAIRPEVWSAFEQVLAQSTAVLDYLRDK